MQWRKEDVARSKFCLSIVLQAQNRPGEARILRREALKVLQDLVSARERPGEPGGNEDKWEMEWYGLNIALRHGRTTRL
jgi:hypothetical protein